MSNGKGRGLLELDENRWLQCPQCGFEYTHVDAVVMENAAGEALMLMAEGEDNNSIITVEDIENEKGRSRDVGRRHVLTVVIECENGCTTWLELKQHKGVTETRLYGEEALPLSSTGTFADLYVEEEVLETRKEAFERVRRERMFG